MLSDITIGLIILIIIILFILGIGLFYLTKIKKQQNDSNTKKKSTFDGYIFSKYIKRNNNNNNFYFSKLYTEELEPTKKATEKVEEQIKKDYSKYNGYNETHICHGCKCLKRKTGYKFCGKFVPGMGTVGCSESWKCRQCGKCDNQNADIFNAEKIKQINNVIRNNNKLVNVKPYSNLNKVKINNITKVDIDNLF
tara:strand:+ start:122 stop:706 length:585 start_codon:yes stop_codon:yes gene_type:complete